MPKLKNMIPFTIKHLFSDDIPVIIALQEKIWQPTYAEILSKEQMDYMFEKIYSPQSLLSQMENGHQFLLVLKGGKPVGFSSLSALDGAIFKLHKIYLLPEVQGAGAGKYLLNQTEKYAKMHGGTRIILNVNRYNKALGFYQRLGYQIVKEEDIAIGPYWMNDFVLEKFLN